MENPLLQMVYIFYTKQREILLYLFFGGISFVINIGVFYFLNQILIIHDLISNVISWVVCVLFQFLTNRKWVFSSTSQMQDKLQKQMIEFFCGRVATLILEELILIVFVTWLALNSLYVKLFAQVLVILLNYVISKLLVFK